MSSARSLTGGTNDVNPQPLRCRVVPAAFTPVLTTAAWGAGGTTTVALPIPVQRLSTGGRAQVMEILGWSYDVTAVATTNAWSTVGYTICLSSRSNAVSPPTMGVADPYTVDYVIKAVPTVNSLSYYDSGKRDLTDGAGHGILFGMDTLYVQGNINGSQASAGVSSSGFAVDICIWYRWKNVGFSEYVGMVTSS